MSDTTTPAPTTRTPIALGSVLTTIAVLAMAAAMIVLLLTRTYPAENKDMVLLIVGAVLAWAGSAVSYWLGSSAGSARKDELLHASTPLVGDGR